MLAQTRGSTRSIASSEVDGLRDEQKALTYLKKAAALGDESAAFDLGIRHLNGTLVPTDTGAAVRLFRQAAHDGHDMAAHNVASMYYEGLGLTQNYDSAYVYFRRAATGYAQSQAMRGLMIWAGRGVERNEAAGVYEMCVARDQGAEGFDDLLSNYRCDEKYERIPMRARLARQPIISAAALRAHVAELIHHASSEFEALHGEQYHNRAWDALSTYELPGSFIRRGPNSGRLDHITLGPLLSDDRRGEIPELKAALEGFMPDSWQLHAFEHEGNPAYEWRECENMRGRRVTIRPDARMGSQGSIVEVGVYSTPCPNPSAPPRSR